MSYLGLDPKSPIGQRVTDAGKKGPRAVFDFLIAIGLKKNTPDSLPMILTFLGIFQENFKIDWNYTNPSTCPYPFISECFIRGALVLGNALSTLKMLGADGFDINKKDLYDGRTPLSHACEHATIGPNGVPEAIDSGIIYGLLGQGADPTIADRYGRRPSYWAAMKGSIGAMGNLIQATPQSKDPLGLKLQDPPLWVAAQFGQAKMMRFLTTMGATATPRRWKDMIPQMPLNDGGSEPLDLLLYACMRPPSSLGPLYENEPSWFGSVAALKVIVEEIGIDGKKGDAADWPCFKTAMTFLAVEIPDMREGGVEDTKAQYRRHLNRVAGIAYLASHATSLGKSKLPKGPNVPGAQKKAKQGDAADSASATGADASAGDAADEMVDNCPIYAAIEAGSFGVAEGLATSPGVNTNLCVPLHFPHATHRGTVLHAAIQNSTSPLSLIRAIIESPCGTDINAVCTMGRTPLFHACYIGRIPAVVLLLRSGARLDVKDKAGMTVFTLLDLPLTHGIALPWDVSVKKVLETLLNNHAATVKADAKKQKQEEGELSKMD